MNPAHCYKMKKDVYTPYQRQVWRNRPKSSRKTVSYGTKYEKPQDNANKFVKSTGKHISNIGSTKCEKRHQNVDEPVKSLGKPSSNGTKSEKPHDNAEDLVKKNKNLVMPPYANAVPINIEVMNSVKNKPMSPLAREFFKYVRTGMHKKAKRMIKDKVIDVNVRDTEDPLLPTPLMAAVELEDVEMVKLLLTAKPTPANVNDENIRGRRVIWLAAHQNHKEITELLLNTKVKCEVNVVDKETGSAPLFCTVIKNAVEICRMLVKAGADVNLRRLGFDFGNETPLIKAIQLDHRDICELLLNSLCKLQTKTDLGLNALHYAVAYCRYDICELLLKSGIKIHAKSNAGVTAMAVAIQNHNAAMVRLLLKNGYKMDKRYKWKETPLEQAIKLHSTESAITIMHFGCSLKKKLGVSYLYMAVNEKLIRIAKFLVALNPYVVNEDWIRNSEWPVSIYHRPDVFKWLTREASMPNKLKELCRSSIFKYLGSHAPSKAKELPLPEKLIDYVQFNDYIRDKYYQQRPLDSGDCPFDCPAICSVRQCVPIEIPSDSEADSDDSVE